MASQESGNDTASGAGPAVRRTLQNRLNQRTFRQRRLQQEKQAGIQRRSRGRPRKDAKTVISRHCSASQTTARDDEDVIELVRHAREGSLPVRPVFLCHLDSVQTSEVMGQLAHAINCRFLQGSPTVDLLLPLTQLNGFRAIEWNMAAIRLTFEVIKDQDAISSFNIPTATFDRHAVPPSLHPTSLQRSQVHHPYIDPLPIPSLRDALLRYEGLYDDYDFCRDMAGTVGEAGMVVWGEPWDPYGWEVTEKFARKWMWLLGSCHELLVATNYWRAQRGEADLFPI